MVIAKSLIEFGEKASFAVGGGLVETLFVVDNELRSALRGHKVELTIFVDSFGRTKPERFVFDHRAACSSIVIPAQKVRHIFAGDIGAVEYAVAVVRRRKAMYVILSGFCDDV